MPIYEYSCGKCNAKFEELVRTMSGGERCKCPKCGSHQTARALSVFAVGGQSSGKSASMDSSPGMCGRCGGPGPCASGGDF